MSDVPIQVLFSIPSEALPTGKNNYELACDNGFEGSVVEWLESLRGPEGPEGPEGPSGGSNSPGVVNLQDYMDAQYGPGLWTKRTGVGAGSDIGPALTAALTDIRATWGRGKVIVPPGTWLMKTTPTAAQRSGCMIEGLGSMASLIVYDADDGCPFSFSGAGGYTGGGVKGLGLLLEDGHPNSTATAFRLQGDATFQPDQMEFNDIYCSALGNSYWHDGFQAVGTARTSPQGIRVCDVRNLQMFRCRNTGIYIQAAVQWTMENIGVYAGLGSGNNFYIAGGGNSNTNTTQITVRRLACSGDLNLTNCSHFEVTGKAVTVSTHSGATYGDVCVPGAVLQGSFGTGVRLFLG